MCKPAFGKGDEPFQGNPDGIHIKIEKVPSQEIRYIDALKVTKVEVHSPDEGKDKIIELLLELGIENGCELLEILEQSYGMRGAILLNVDTFKRLEPDRERGIRATYMDVACVDNDKREKNHFKEALVLASKVIYHPNIVGEICISDDPEYVTGYFASKKHGYVRITQLKEFGSELGGRVFLYRGSECDVEKCIHYLEKEKVLVRGVYEQMEQN